MSGPQPGTMESGLNFPRGQGLPVCEVLPPNLVVQIHILQNNSNLVVTIILFISQNFFILNLKYNF